jgi:hypothetical protein
VFALQAADELAHAGVRANAVGGVQAGTHLPVEIKRDEVR